MDRFGVFSGFFRPFSECVGIIFVHLLTVSDGFGFFSDRFQSRADNFRTTLFLMSKKKFQLATLSVPCAVPLRPPSRGHLKFEILTKIGRKRYENGQQERTKTKTSLTQTSHTEAKRETTSPRYLPRSRVGSRLWWRSPP